MKIVVLDIGSIAPAYFSQPVITYLRQAGHQVDIRHTFDVRECAAADLVWSEWTNEIAFEAAAAGVCKRLVLRMRGYDVWYPLDQLKWENVDALVYESESLKDLAEERFPFLVGDYDGQVMPAGIDLTKFKWKERGPGNVYALVARATSDKGYQLAMEWAWQHPEITLHMTLAFGDQNPRLVRYLQHIRPYNVRLHERVDTATWLDEIGANYLLQPSIWETLSYTVAEAMALGIKPLIHDFPGAVVNWPRSLVWENFKELDTVIQGGYDSKLYRRWVEDRLDGAVQSEKFVALLEEVVKRDVSRSLVAVPDAGSTADFYTRFRQALLAGDFAAAEQAVMKLAQMKTHEITAAAAIQLAAATYEAEDFDMARLWALMSMSNGPRTDAMCLLGEVEAGESVERAREWYELACALPETRSRVNLTPLIRGRDDRLEELEEELDPNLSAGSSPGKYVVIVPVRNAEKWIRRCLESVEAQKIPAVRCVVVDDASTDGTVAEIDAFIGQVRRHTFVKIENDTRLGSLKNIYRAIQTTSMDPSDVCVILDGDDWFSDSYALVAVEKAYQAGAWMTYGSWKDTAGNLSWMGAYPMKVAREGLHRTVPWAGTHLKTFRRFLFDKIDQTDFQDDNGNWFTTGGDVALMIPMLEMARERALFIPDVLYTYNMETPDNDHKIDPAGQTRVRDLVFSRKPYPRLELLEPGVPKHLLEKAKNSGATVFIETGFYLGHSVNTAQMLFDDLYSVELSEDLWKKGKEMFARVPSVRVLHGDSGELLPGILSEVGNRRAVLWLDAHYSAGMTARGSTDTAIRAELDSLAAASRRDHFLLVDDLEDFTGTNGYPTVEELVKLVKQINPNYNITIHKTLRRGILEATV